MPAPYVRHPSAGVPVEKRHTQASQTGEAILPSKISRNLLSTHSPSRKGVVAVPDQIEAIREPWGGWCLWDTVEDDFVTTSSGALAIGLTEDEALE